MSRILVVDDSALARESLARLLASAGHMAATAANGRDAWAMLYEGIPDLILLDLMMPQMDGITFLKLLRHSDHWAHVPVIVITGFSDDEQLVGQARKLGVADVLPKMSCGVGQLLTLVDHTLAQTCKPLPRHQTSTRSMKARASSPAAAFASGTSPAACRSGPV
jgi:CheY-like chemotaxis protein